MGLFTMSHSFTNESIYEKSLRVYKDIVLANPYEYNKCKKTAVYTQVNGE